MKPVLTKLFLQNRWLREDLLAELGNTDVLDLPPEDRRTLIGLVNLYGGNNSAGIDYYGPPTTINTLRCHDILLATEDQAKQTLAAKAVAKTWAKKLDDRKLGGTQVLELFMRALEL